jgi:hypothetical protein
MAIWDHNPPEDRLCRVPGCTFGVVEGSIYCPRHGAYNDLKMRAYERELSFMEQRIRARLENPVSLRLTTELAILREILETRLTRVKNEDELLINATNIEGTIDKIRVLVREMTSLQKTLGDLVPKEQVNAFISEFVSAATEALSGDEVLLAKVYTKLAEAAQSRGYDMEAPRAFVQLSNGHLPGHVHEPGDDPSG